ncbi:MAG: UvrD-helicase domain-containing protein [Candidatus Paceibacterota bacterium]
MLSNYKGLKEKLITFITMPIRHLINNDGQPFDKAELQTLRADLDALPDNERAQFRNDNAQAIAQHPAIKILIVSGPGTGKSTLFKQRINYWLRADPLTKILALSFVRKLVADLQHDIQGDRNLTDKQKKQTDVFTLHKYARSIVEKNHGTVQIRFDPHFRIISESWQDTVWNDVLLYAGQSDHNRYSWKNYEKQLHDAHFENFSDWQNLKNGYLTLNKFYNATGFADLIIYAKSALLENSSLNEHDFLIIDEYQDFNTAEEELINQLSRQSRGLLVVGDDDQVLYEKLKSGKAVLIRNLYSNTDFVNTMLPFCGRSSLHITKVAGHFISQGSESNCIEKIYLPLSVNTEHPKVQVIGCATSTTAVDYIKKFIDDNKSEIETRKNELIDGNTKDPFLLILTPAKEVKFYAAGHANQELFKLIAEFQQETKKFSEDYYKVLNYYSLANHPENNFIFRKVLSYEQVPDMNVVELIRKCLMAGVNFYNLEETETILSSALIRCQKIKAIIESSDNIDIKLDKIGEEINLSDPVSLKNDIDKRAINETQIQEIEHEEEEEAELDELEIQQMSAVELITIVGSKGLSADHVIIIGFDNVNMSWVTRNAFYVAITRARKSLHIITALGSGGSQKPHDFVVKLPDQHIEFFKYTKSNKQKTLLNNRAGFNQYFESLNYTRRKNKKV